VNDTIETSLFSGIYDQSSVDSGNESIYDRGVEKLDQPFQGGEVMKKPVLMLCVLSLVAPSVMALDAYPITTLNELYTSTT